MPLGCVFCLSSVVPRPVPGLFSPCLASCSLLGLAFSVSRVPLPGSLLRLTLCGACVGSLCTFTLYGLLPVVVLPASYTVRSRYICAPCLAASSSFDFFIFYSIAFPVWKRVSSLVSVVFGCLVLVVIPAVGLFFPRVLESKTVLPCPPRFPAPFVLRLSRSTFWAFALLLCGRFPIVLAFLPLAPFGSRFLFLFCAFGVVLVPVLL